MNKSISKTDLILLICACFVFQLPVIAADPSDSPVSKGLSVSVDQAPTANPEMVDRQIVTTFSINPDKPNPPSGERVESKWKNQNYLITSKARNGANGDDGIVLSISIDGEVYKKGIAAPATHKYNVSWTSNNTVSITKKNDLSDLPGSMKIVAKFLEPGDKEFRLRCGLAASEWDTATPTKPIVRVDRYYKNNTLVKTDNSDVWGANLALVKVLGDIPSHAPSTTAKWHSGHCSSETYWDYTGDKMTGFTLSTPDYLVEQVQKSASANPFYTSNAKANSSGKLETHYYMIADRSFTYKDKTYNGDLDKYWFNKTVRDSNSSGNHKSDNKITMTFINYRAFCGKEFDDIIIGKKASIYICLYDLDDKGSSTSSSLRERAVLSINGGPGAVLESVIAEPNGKWQVLKYTFNTSDLKFPDKIEKPAAGKYPKAELNEVTITLDTLDQGWALEVDWAVIDFRAMSPIMFVHGAGQSHDFWDYYDSMDIDFGDAFYYTLDPKYPIDDQIDITGRDGGEGTATIPRGGTVLSSEIPKRVCAFGAFSFNLIAHSKGGLWSRSFLENHLPATKLSLGEFITLATPHYGSVMADYVNAMHFESVLAFVLGVRQHFPLGGTVPYGYRTMRLLYWPPDPNDVIGDEDYWNRSYVDLGPVAVGTFNGSNIPFMNKYKNFDGTKPDYIALSADADRNGDNIITEDDEFSPLEWDMDLIGFDSDAKQQRFYTALNEALANVYSFDYRAVRIGRAPRRRLQFVGVQMDLAKKYALGNDLIVTVPSASGNPDPSRATLPKVPVRHIPYTTWWSGAPDTTNHATIASEECGEYVRDNVLVPLH